VGLFHRLLECGSQERTWCFVGIDQGNGTSENQCLGIGIRIARNFGERLSAAAHKRDDIENFKRYVMA
jgi:hypothetical protein